MLKSKTWSIEPLSNTRIWKWLRNKQIYKDMLKNLSEHCSLFLKFLRGHQIYIDMLNTLGEQCPSYATMQNWIASWKRETFSIEDEHINREG